MVMAGEAVSKVIQPFFEILYLAANYLKFKI